MVRVREGGSTWVQMEKKNRSGELQEGGGGGWRVDWTHTHLFPHFAVVKSKMVGDRSVISSVLLHGTPPPQKAHDGHAPSSISMLHGRSLA